MVRPLIRSCCAFGWMTYTVPLCRDRWLNQPACTFPPPNLPAGPTPIRCVAGGMKGYHGTSGDRQFAVRAVYEYEPERLPAGIDVLVLDALRNEHERVGTERGALPVFGHDLAIAADDEVHLLGLGVVVQRAGLAGLEDGQPAGEELAAAELLVDDPEDLAAEAGVVEAEPDRLGLFGERVDDVDHDEPPNKRVELMYVLVR